MTGYTKGPWRAAPSGQIVVVNSSKQICRVWNTRNRDQDQANASLIAAAPDLLEALEKGVTRLEANLDDERYMGRGSMTYLLETFQAAIAKARGEA